MFSQENNIKKYNSIVNNKIEKRLSLKGISPKNKDYNKFRDSLKIIIKNDIDKTIEENKTNIKSFARTDNSIMSTCTDIPQSEKAALQDIFNQLNGTSWATNWDFSIGAAPVTSWNSSTSSGWYGIKVENCHVTELYISNQEIEGFLPNTITNLTELEILGIMPHDPGFAISGDFSIISNFSKLRSLTLNHCFFNDDIPLSYINLNDSLEYLHLNECNLGDNDRLCSVVSNLHLLESLIIIDNNYSGTFPNCINSSNLPLLKRISFLFNNFSDIGNLNLSIGLEHIDFRHNLVYDFPYITDLMNLKDLYLSDNFLEGNIPNIFFNKQMRMFDVAFNNLNGNIPIIGADNSSPTRNLYLFKNKFRFIDLVENFDYLKANFITFGYSPQAYIDNELILNVNEGELVTLKMFEDDVFLNDDRFQWYKYYPANPVTPEIIGDNTYTFVATPGTEGVYFCVARHFDPEITLDYNYLYNYTNFQGYIHNFNLSLIRKNIRVNVSPFTPPPCYDCTSFDLLKDEKYLVSAWVKEEYENDPNRQFKNYDNSAVSIGFTNFYGNFLTAPVQFFPSGEIIDGWQRIVGEFVVPTDVDDIHIELLNLNQDGKVTYFDDVRVLPSKGNMKSFVYDQKTQRLMAELDENNYSTFYEYDLEGGLIRVKKETERGVFTIQETRSGNTKK